MSFVNFLGLDDPGYGNFAKGILYVIYEIIWKIVYGIASVIDAVTGIFYKIAGSNYLGSGNETLVEEQDLLSKLFNQNVFSKVYLFFSIIAVSLMAVFALIAVVKQNYFSKEGPKSTTFVIKNMVVSFVILLVLAPLSLFAISSITTIASAVMSVFGSNDNVSLADVLVSSSFKGDAIATYNAIYGEGNAEWVNITSWTEMKNNDFLFELNNSSAADKAEFYPFVYMLGAGIVLFNLAILVVRLFIRIFRIIILYITGPIYVARIANDGGNKFKEWMNNSLVELIYLVGSVVGFMILISLVGTINDIELISTGSKAVSDSSGLGLIVEEEEVSEAPVVIATSTFLINSLARVFLLSAGAVVAKDSGELLSNAFKGANENSALLEGILDKVNASKEGVKVAQGGTKTRVITRNTTSTRRVINYNETVPSGGGPGARDNINVHNNQRVFNNASVNNINRSINNIQSRTSLQYNGGTISDSGGKVGNYRNVNAELGDLNKMATAPLNEALVKTYKQENDKLRNDWAFMKNSNSSESREVVKNFESASKDFDSSLKGTDPVKIKDSMSRYVSAYRKEEKVAKEGYKEFAGKSTKLSNDLSAKQQDELRRISNAYRKAQYDYSKTASKLSQVSQGNMSTSDALRLKERADKQREKLMAASSKANDFYNNQKKGV